MYRRQFLREIGIGLIALNTAPLIVSCVSPGSIATRNKTSTGIRATSPHFWSDVVIYGGTSAGVIAAYTVRRYGKSVLLIEPGRHLGGLSSGGLGRTDVGDRSAITGIARDFYRRIGKYYGQEEPGWRFEPRVAEQMFEDYLDEVQAEVLFSRRVKEVRKNGNRIQELVLEYAGDGSNSQDLLVQGDLFLDTSYEGDLMAGAGVSYAVGRESNSQYHETHDGVQMGHPRQYHQFPDGIDPYVIPGKKSSGLLPEINGYGVQPRGTGDKKIQAYNFRMCLTQDPDNLLPFSEPDNYDPDRYHLLLRVMAAKPWDNLRGGFIISEMPRGKTDWNNYGPFSTDYIGKNWEYPEADYSQRARMWQEHEEYQKGLMYFLGHDERVPRKLREEMQSWGLCRDEFLDTGGWPNALYIREARRMIGSHVMTDRNIVGGEHVKDGIAWGSYNMDSHNVQRVVIHGDGGDMVKNEGDVEQPSGGPYPIAYRSLTPKPEEAANLLVPVALSATHIAYGSIRMEPVFMELGQAAGVAASLALEKQVAVQEVDVRAIQQELREKPLAGMPPPSGQEKAYRLP